MWRIDEDLESKHLLALQSTGNFEHVKLLFALISVNTSLPTPRSKSQGLVIVDLVDDENVPVHVSQPAAKAVRVAAI